MRIGYCPRCNSPVPAFGRFFVWQAHACPRCGVLLRSRGSWRFIGVPLLLISGIIVGVFMRTGMLSPADLLVPITFAMAGIIMITISSSQRVVAEGPFCPACLYNRRGLAPDAPCPECGKVPAV